MNPVTRLIDQLDRIQGCLQTIGKGPAGVSRADLDVLSADLEKRQADLLRQLAALLDDRDGSRPSAALTPSLEIGRDGSRPSAALTPSLEIGRRQRSAHRLEV